MTYYNKRLIQNKVESAYGMENKDNEGRKPYKIVLENDNGDVQLGRCRQ